MAGLSLRGIYKKYPGGVVAVSDVNLEIRDKEFIVLVGPSGCGKSTTLRMIAGLEEISEGELYIGDRLVNDIAPKDRDIAMVFQNYALYPHMTVFENMAQVRDEVEKAAYEIYNQYIREGLKEKQPFKGTGKAYVRMAREEPKLFRLLFMTGTPQAPNVDDLMQYVDKISTTVTDAAKESFEIDRETAKKLHHHLWIYSHGIAVLQATGVCNFTDEETDAMLTEVGLSLIKHMKE